MEWCSALEALPAQEVPEHSTQQHLSLQIVAPQGGEYHNAPLHPASFVNGIFRPSRAALSEVIILCEQWPGWIYACGALQFRCTHVYCWADLPSWAAQLTTVYPDVCFRFCAKDIRLPVHPPFTPLLMQGSIAWFEDVITKLSHMSAFLFSATFLEPLTRPTLPPDFIISQYTLQSTDVGSALRGTWLFCSRGFEIPLPPTSYHRALHHIINDTTRCAFFHPCQHTEECTQRLHAPLMVQQALALHPVPSVFAKSGFVRRQLSVAELARAFDVPSSVLPTFADGSQQYLPWLLHAPTRLLVYVGGVAPRRNEDRVVKEDHLSPLEVGNEKSPELQEDEDLGVNSISMAVAVRNRNAERPRAGVTAAAGASFDLPTASPLPSALSASDQRQVTVLAGASLSSETARPQDNSATRGELETWWHHQAKSVKADDAANPTHLWDDRVWRSPHDTEQRRQFTARYGRCALDTLRHFLLRRWQRNLWKSLCNHLITTYGRGWKEMIRSNSQLRLDVVAGRDCLWRASESDWWDWRSGSRLFFWRWPEAHRQAARDGYEPYIEGKLPRYLRPQAQESDPQVRAKVRAKLETVRNRQYVAKGKVLSLTSYFSVPKGDSDVRMVYDATRSNLNACLWAPNFGMPTVEILLRGINEESWMGDLDIGEMF